MSPLKYPPRLSRDEIRALGKAATALMTVHQSLQHTNWAGAAPSAVIVGESIEVIARVFVRCRHFLPEVQAELEAAAREAQQQSEAGAELSGESGAGAGAAEES